ATRRCMNEWFRCGGVGSGLQMACSSGRDRAAGRATVINYLSTTGQKPFCYSRKKELRIGSSGGNEQMLAIKSKSGVVHPQAASWLRGGVAGLVASVALAGCSRTPPE